MNHRFTLKAAAATIGLCGVLAGCGDGRPWPPGVQSVGRESPVLTPEEALETFYMPPGYGIELVASEPLVTDPVAIDFDADGRMYVVEMRGYMPNLAGEGEDEPVGRVVVLEDADDDGRMDRSTVFLDSLVLPRAVKVLDRGVMVAAPPYLWLVRDTDGDLKADTREVVRDDYGNPQANPEHNANGLFWGLDNWIHNAKYEGQFRLVAGSLEYRRTPSLGQWGVSTDDWGRLYRNANSAPLHADLVPAHYFGRNPDLIRARGAYEELADNGPVWPVRPNPGINRGYRESMLREDSTLARFTAAGSPVVYRGDRLPEELRGNAFVTEPAGNLVRRYVIRESEDGFPTAENAYEEAEFVASTDERFRPVNLYSAPDGTLYVVDMYRGIIQHRRYITGWLETQIRARNLATPVGYGRIYRVVHEDTERAAAPRLSGASPTELVELLSHPNGWWRDVAQRLLVERQASTVAPALRWVVQNSANPRARLHALWTLDGLQAADPHTLADALLDPAGQVRAAAIRIAEPWLAFPDHPLHVALLDLTGHPHPLIRRQVAASLGSLPPEVRVPELVKTIDRFGDDPVVVDLAISGVPDAEMALLQRLLDRAAAQAGRRRDAVQVLAGTLIAAGAREDMRRVMDWIGDERRPTWQRVALLEGLHGRIPQPEDDGRFLATLEIPDPPGGLITAGESPDTAVRRRARYALRGLSWPGKPEDPSVDRPRLLTPEEEERFASGEELYAHTCSVCHGEAGEGGVGKPLVGSRWVVGDPRALARILLHGKEGEQLMPPVGGTLSDEEIAAVMTYTRRAWGHHADPVDAAFVAEQRGQTTGRDRPWTEEELGEGRR